MQKPNITMQKSPTWLLALRSPLTSWLRKINTGDSAANNTRKHIIPYSAEAQTGRGEGRNSEQHLEKREMEAEKGIRKGCAEELRLNAWASNMARIERIKKEVQVELRKSCGAVDSAENSAEPHLRGEAQESALKHFQGIQMQGVHVPHTLGETLIHRIKSKSLPVQPFQPHLPLPGPSSPPSLFPSLPHPLFQGLASFICK